MLHQDKISTAAEEQLRTACCSYKLQLPYLFNPSADRIPIVFLAGFHRQ